MRFFWAFFKSVLSIKESTPLLLFWVLFFFGFFFFFLVFFFFGLDGCRRCPLLWLVVVALFYQNVGTELNSSWKINPCYLSRFIAQTSTWFLGWLLWILFFWWCCRGAVQSANAIRIARHSSPRLNLVGYGKMVRRYCADSSFSLKNIFFEMGFFFWCIRLEPRLFPAPRILQTRRLENMIRHGRYCLAGRANSVSTFSIPFRWVGSPSD